MSRLIAALFRGGMLIEELSVGCVEEAML